MDSHFPPALIMRDLGSHFLNGILLYFWCLFLVFFLKRKGCFNHSKVDISCGVSIIFPIVIVGLVKWECSVLGVS